MSSLESFMDEMLTDQGKKEGFLNDLLENLETQPIPTLEQAQTGYTTMSNLHGIYYDYDSHNITISYKVVPDLYEDYTMNFLHFAVVVEGLISCRRRQRWLLDKKS